MSTKEHVKCIWREADAVCFDVDSTVCQDEGLDELANFCGAGPQVAEWTNRAMGGGVTFREALTERLNIFKPTLKNVEDFIKSCPPKFSPGVKELISLLKSKNIPVFLVSGGFRSIITPVANELGIPQEKIFANRLLFSEDGSYAGFDTEEPTSESGGKPRVAQLIKERFGVKTLVVIGDGATDMEACPPADAFIGYGGNVVRDKVKEKASWFVTDFKELIDEISNRSQS